MKSRPTMLLAAAALLGACKARAPAAPDAAATIAAAPAPDAAVPPPDAAPRTPEQVLAMRLAARRVFDRQGEVEPPDPLANLRPLGPEVKVVRAEAGHHMKNAQPAAGLRWWRMTWITAAEPADRERLWAERLVATKWLPPGERPAGALRDAAGRSLVWQAEEAPAEPTRVDVTLEVDGDTARPELPRAPAWLVRAPEGLRVVGYESGRYHRAASGARATDVERLTVALEAADAARLAEGYARLLQAVAAAGYVTDPADARLWRHPDGRTFTSRPVEGRDAQLVVHHQRRWAR